MWGGGGGQRWCVVDGVDISSQSGSALVGEFLPACTQLPHITPSLDFLILPSYNRLIWGRDTVIHHITSSTGSGDRGIRRGRRTGGSLSDLHEHVA